MDSLPKFDYDRFCSFLQMSPERPHTDGAGERPPLAELRRREIAELLRGAGAVTVAELEQRFAVSSMTARRDLAELERQGLARRTHGGAVLPASSAHEDSFGRRLDVAPEAKRALARMAAASVTAEQVLFLDSSSTSYVVAHELLDRGIAVTLITNSLPIMALVAARAEPQVELIGIGGTLRRHTRSYVGPAAVHAVTSYFADRLFLSVKGVSADGRLTDADPLEAEVKRAMIAQAAEPTLLLHHDKLGVRGLHAIARLDELGDAIVHGASRAQLAALRAGGLGVRVA